MQWFRDIGIGVKLSLMLSAFSSVLLISLIVLLVFNTQSLTQEVATEQINQELDTLQTRLNSIQNDIESDISFLIADITFFQAVGRRSQSDLDTIIGRTELSSDAFDVEIVDGDGNLLVDTQTDGDLERDMELVNQARDNTAQSTISVEGEGSQIQINISSVSPVLSVTGNFLGAIRVQRQIDDVLLQDITSQRDDVFVGLIYDNRILARNDPTSQSETALIPGISIDTTAIDEAESGEPIIIEDLVTSDNIPYKVGYIPVTIDDLRSPVTLMVLVELSNLNTFQTQTLNNTISIFVVLTMLTVFMIYVTLRQLTINPITRLRTIAQKMVEGSYDQRIPVTGKDELGQLAATFNVMVNTIQERESSLKEAHDEAERANQVKSAFLASMSHELRTPLNAIINFSGFVADGDIGPVNEQQQEILGDVVRSAKHLLNLINDVLDMSKIEAGSLQLFIADDLNVNEIITNTVSTAQTLLGDKPVEVKINLDDDIPLISGDKQRITQVLLNLVSNACKFTDTGSVTVTSHRQGDDIILSVADTGSGIAAKDINGIFEAFIQTEDGLRQGGGTGLGLPISKNLVEAHKGELWVESTEGKGSTFYVRIPIVIPNMR